MASAMISIGAFHVRGEQLWNVSNEGNLETPTLTLMGAVLPETVVQTDQLVAEQSNGLPGENYMLK